MDTPLVGLYFVTYAKDEETGKSSLQFSGQVVGHPEPGYWLVQYYLATEFDAPSNLAIVGTHDMTGWKLYHHDSDRIAILEKFHSAPFARPYDR